MVDRTRTLKVQTGEPIAKQNGVPTAEQTVEAADGAGTTSPSVEIGVGATGVESGEAAEPKEYTASIFPGPDRTVPRKFAEVVRELEGELGMPIWLLVHHYPRLLDDEIVEMFFEQRHSLPEGSPVALLIDSPGGLARSAYQLARFLRECCGGFLAIVPRFSKSAATLLTLGGSEIILSKHAELGPLDVQIYDAEYERHMSGLDEVQALERLHASALEAVDQFVLMWTIRSGKKVDTLLPTGSHFVSEMMRPLFDKIDTVSFTQKSRLLKEAEEYAIRLLQGKYRPDKARAIARSLVENYPEHGFIIDAQEASKIGLQLIDPTPEQQALFDRLRPFLRKMTVVGHLQEVTG